MSAAEKPIERYVPQEVEDQYETVLNLYARRQFYKLGDPPVDFTAQAHDQLNLDGSETILDLGCANAEILRGFYNQYNHRGNLIGVDINKLLFSGARESFCEPGQRLDLIVGEAQHLPLETNSVDVALGLFMLYHVPSPEQALREMQRVVRPGGQVLIATSGVFNKARHRQFEKVLAEYFKTSPPYRFSEPFDDTVAEQLLPCYFDDVQVKRYRGLAKLYPDDQEGQSYYAWSLLGMRMSFGRNIYRSEWEVGVENCVRPLISAEQSQLGYFTDYYDLAYFSARNNKAV